MSALPLELDRDRKELLERYGVAYAREAFAIAWTDGIAGDAAKRVTSRGWPHTRPLPSSDGGAFAAGLFATRGRTRNPAVTARASGLVVVECDTTEGLSRLEALGLPPTWTVRSSLAHKQHRYFRWPEGDEPAKVAIRFEPAAITADREHYFLLPPALHPSGTAYTFLPGLGPDSLPIAELPEPSFRELLRLAGVTDNVSDPASPPAPIVPPSTSLTREQLHREKLERLFAASSPEDAERIAADPLGGGHSPLAYGQRVLENACARVAATPKGSRHTVLNKSAYVVGGYLAATGLDREQVVAALRAAAEEAGLGEREQRQTDRAIARGLDVGAARPREIPELAR